MSNDIVQRCDLCDDAIDPCRECRILHREKMVQQHYAENPNADCEKLSKKKASELVSTLRGHREKRVVPKKKGKPRRLKEKRSLPPKPMAVEAHLSCPQPKERMTMKSSVTTQCNVPECKEYRLNAILNICEGCAMILKHWLIRQKDESQMAIKANKEQINYFNTHFDNYTVEEIEKARR